MTSESYGRHKKKSGTDVFLFFLLFFLFLPLKQHMQIHYSAYCLCFLSVCLVILLFALFLSEAAIQATECHDPIETAAALISLSLDLCTLPPLCILLSY